MDNPNEDSRQGTAMICVNNAWGSVCRDDYFDNTDAAVFCSQLQGFVPDGKKQLLIYFLNYFSVFLFSSMAGASENHAAATTTITGPLFLSSLDCTATDKSLLYGCNHDTLGLATCDDGLGLAVVKCFGNDLKCLLANALNIVCLSDADECSLNTDNCSQNCSDTLGSYQCVCYDGYTLDSDQHTCNGEYSL